MFHPEFCGFGVSAMNKVRFLYFKWASIWRHWFIRVVNANEYGRGRCISVGKSGQWSCSTKAVLCLFSMLFL